MTKVEQLVERLRSMGVVIPDGYQFRRTYAGIRQREAGALSWWIQDDQREYAAGFESVTDLLKSETWDLSRDPASFHPAFVQAV